MGSLRSIRGKLYLQILLPVVAVLAGVVLWQNFTNREKAYSDARRLMEATSKEFANRAEAILSVAMDAARTMAQVFSRFETIPAEHRREVFLGMLRQVLEGNEDFLGVWVCFEPNALDGKDQEFRGQEGHDDTGRFIPYLYRQGGSIFLEPLRDYETPGAGDYYLLARNSGNEVLLEPYEYEIAGKKVLMTTCSVPIKREGKVVGVAGVDMALERFQKYVSTTRIFQSGFLRLSSFKGIVVAQPQIERVGQIWGEAQSNASLIMETMRKGQTYIGMEYSGALQRYVLKAYAPIFVGQVKEPWVATAAVPPEEVFLEANQNFLRSLLFLLAGVAVVVLIILFVSGSLSRPLQALAQGAEKMAQGDLQVHFAEVRGQDETALLSRAFRVMTENLRGMVVQITNVASQLASSGEELSSSIGEISKTTQEIARTISQVAEGSSSQSQDLERITQEAGLIARRVDDLAKATERNLAALQEMVRSVEENFQALQEIERAMNLSLAQGKESREEAQRGQELLRVLSGNIHAIADVAQDVSQAIETLDQRSQEIGKIVEVITGIAEQTNLLALNAAIEAARAGEAGRGFAVVAEEVRKLAENSAQAAQQIAHLINQIGQDTRNAVERMKRATHQVEEGVAQGERVTQSFTQIIKALESSTSGLENLASRFDQARKSQDFLQKRSSEVESLSEDAARGIQEVVQAVASITERINAVAAVAEENAASSQEVSASTEEESASLEELTSAAESLAKLADELRTLVERFRV
ncbi:MAG: methyl-accepting chemotaxis protein [Atribacterota bacterium]